MSFTLLTLFSQVMTLRSTGSRLLRNFSAMSSRIDPAQEALLAEQCILVDEQDREVGKASKKACHTLDGARSSPLHRAFSLFVFNERNELLMTQRSDAKITFPGLWTNTCCSHPLADVDGEGEASEGRGAKLAAQRRIKDELGVRPEDCPVEEMKFLTRILYASPCEKEGKWGEHELDYILFLRGSVPFEPNPNEVKATRYIQRGELKDFIRSVESDGGGVTPWFGLIAGTMLPKWWDRIDEIKSFENDGEIHKFT